jgi:predicted PurR-regulated permease PerM
LVLLALVIYRFRVVIPPLVIAFLLAFILDPIVDFLNTSLRLSRGLATTLVFLILIVGMLGVVAAPVPFFPQIGEAVESLPNTLTSIITEISISLDRPVEIWGYSLDLSPFYEDLNRMLRSFVTTVAEGTVDVAVSVASGAFWLIFILMAAFYMVKDADRLIEKFDRLPPAAYRDDFVRLRQQIAGVWNAFLRGQLLLGLAMAVITTIVCVAIDLPYSIALGLLAGVTEFVPSIGPLIAAIPAILLAWIEGSTFLPLSNFWFAVLVAGLYIVIQQIEGNLLIPRILGRSLNLHPLLVLIAIVLGGSLAGILGMLLAAPVLATLRVVGLYIFCRIYDRDPFAGEKEKEPPKPGLFKRAWEAVLSWLQKRKEQRQEKAEREHAESSDSPGESDG